MNSSANVLCEFFSSKANLQPQEEFLVIGAALQNLAQLLQEKDWRTAYFLIRHKYLDVNRLDLMFSRKADKQEAKRLWTNTLRALHNLVENG